MSIGFRTKAWLDVQQTNRFQGRPAFVGSLRLDSQYKGEEAMQRELCGRRDSLPPAHFSAPNHYENPIDSSSDDSRLQRNFGRITGATADK
jgi:hypothetical protein